MSPLRNATDRLRSFVKGDFLRHGAIVFASSMVVNASNYIFHFFMTRSLGPVTYGALSSLIALSAVLSLPAAIMTLLVVKYASELHGAGDTNRLRRLLEYVLKLSMAGSAIVLVICMVCSGAIARYLQEPDAGAIMIVAVIVAIGLMNPALRGILQGTQDFWALAAACGLEGVGKCVFGVALAAMGWGLRGALIGYAIACIVSLFYALASLARYRFVKPMPLRIDFKRLLRTVVGIGFATIALQLAGSFDVILVKHYFEPAMAGVYSAVALAGKAVLFIVGFVPSIVLPKAAARATEGKRATPVLLQGLALTAVMSVAVLAIMSYAPVAVMHIFSGTAYLSGAAYLPWYVVAMIFLGAASTVANYQIALHRFQFIIPLAVCFVCEAGAVIGFHSSIHSVLVSLIVGNAALFLSALYVPNRARVSTNISPVHSASTAR